MGGLKGQAGIDPAPDGVGGENGHVAGPAAEDDAGAFI